MPSPDVLVHRDTEERRRRVPWRWIIVGIDVLLLAGVFSAQYWPLLKVREIQVEAPAEWIERARGLVAIPADSNLLSVDLDNLETKMRIEFGGNAECRACIELPDKVCLRIRPAVPLIWTETGEGIALDGALCVSPVVDNNAPVLRSSFASFRPEPPHRAASAAAVWNRLCEADERFENAVSELERDPARGWVMTAVDGRSRVVLGWTNLEERARRVTRLLDTPDTAIVWPCEIDARFDSYLVLRAIEWDSTSLAKPEPEDTDSPPAEDSSQVEETTAIPGGGI